MATLYMSLVRVIICMCSLILTFSYLDAENSEYAIPRTIIWLGKECSILPVKDYSIHYYGIPIGFNTEYEICRHQNGTIKAGTLLSNTLINSGDFSLLCGGERIAFYTEDELAKHLPNIGFHSNGRLSYAKLMVGGQSIIFSSGYPVTIDISFHDNGTIKAGFLSEKQICAVGKRKIEFSPHNRDALNALYERRHPYSDIEFHRNGSIARGFLSKPTSFSIQNTEFICAAKNIDEFLSRNNSDDKRAPTHTISFHPNGALESCYLHSDAIIPYGTSFLHCSSNSFLWFTEDARIILARSVLYLSSNASFSFRDMQYSFGPGSKIVFTPSGEFNPLESRIVYTTPISTTVYGSPVKADVGSSFLFNSQGKIKIAEAIIRLKEPTTITLSNSLSIRLAKGTEMKMSSESLYIKEEISSSPLILDERLRFGINGINIELMDNTNVYLYNRRLYAGHLYHAISVTNGKTVFEFMPGSRLCFAMQVSNIFWGDEFCELELSRPIQMRISNKEYSFQSGKQISFHRGSTIDNLILKSVYISKPITVRNGRYLIRIPPSSEVSFNANGFLSGATLGDDSYFWIGLNRNTIPSGTKISFDSGKQPRVNMENTNHNLFLKLGQWKIPFISMQLGENAAGGTLGENICYVYSTTPNIKDKYACAYAGRYCKIEFNPRYITADAVVTTNAPAENARFLSNGHGWLSWLIGVLLLLIAIAVVLIVRFKIYFR